MVVHNNKKLQYANYIQQELYPGPLNQTIQPSELIELQSDLCEQNEYQRREMHRINQIIVKL